MSETEHEQPAEPVEPTEDDADDAEADEDETTAQPEAEPTPEQTAAPAKSERDIERDQERLEKEASRHAGRVAEIMGEAAQDLELCARCWPLAPGFHWPLNMAPVSDEQRALVLASLGMGASGEDALPMADGVEECPKCNGYGELRLPTKNPHQQKMTCPQCSGNGYVSNAPEPPPWTPPPLDPATFTPQPQYGANGGQTDQWGRPQGHPHYGQNPVTVGV
jgi:hypothetical protein